MRNHAVPLRYVTEQCVYQIGSMSAHSRKCEIQTILRCGAWAWMDFDDEHVTAYRRASKWRLLVETSNAQFLIRA
jgi:hypothetical protein